MDVVFNRTGLTVGQVAGTQRNRVFGFDPYINPAADHRYRILGGSDNKRRRENFADLAAKAKQWVPGSNQFKQPNWRVPGRNLPISNVEPEQHSINSTDLRRGKFLTKPRDTFTEDVMKFEKAKPAPSQYQFNNLDPKTHREKERNYKVQGTYTQ